MQRVLRETFQESQESEWMITVTQMLLYHLKNVNIRTISSTQAEFVNGDISIKIQKLTQKCQGILFLNKWFYCHGIVKVDWSLFLIRPCHDKSCIILYIIQQYYSLWMLRAAIKIYWSGYYMILFYMLKVMHYQLPYMLCLWIVKWLIAFIAEV